MYFFPRRLAGTITTLMLLGLAPTPLQAATVWWSPPAGLNNMNVAGDRWSTTAFPYNNAGAIPVSTDTAVFADNQVDPANAYTPNAGPAPGMHMGQIDLQGSTNGYILSSFNFPMSVSIGVTQTGLMDSGISIGNVGVVTFSDGASTNTSSTGGKMTYTVDGPSALLQFFGDSGIGDGYSTVNLTGGGTMYLNTAAAKTVVLNGITSDAASFINLNPSVVFHNTLEFGQDNVSHNSAGDELDGVISGTGIMQKEGSGTYVLTGANTYSGGTIVNGGTLNGTTTSLQGNFAMNNSNPPPNEAQLIFQQAFNGTYAGTISGAGAVTINSLGQTVTFSGPNTYSLGTTVSNGTLQGTTTSLQGNIAISSGATLAFNQAVGGTYAGVASGAGTFELLGIGAVTLSQAQTYTGPTLIAAGALQGSVANVISPSSSVNISVGGVFNLNGNNQQINNLSGGGTVTLGANTLNIIETTPTTFSGPINGTGVVEKSGASTLALTSGTSNYSGGTILNGGTLQINTNAALGNVNGPITVSTASTLQAIGPGISTNRTTTLNAPLTIDTNSQGTMTWNGTITGTGTLTKVSPDTLILNGANNYSGATVIQAGTVQPGNNNTLSANSPVQIAAAGTLNVNGFTETIASLADSGSPGGSVTLGAGTLIMSSTPPATTTFSGVISGINGNIDIEGGNILTLRAVNTYTGTTTVGHGTLKAGVSGVIAASSELILGTGGNAGVFDLNGFDNTIQNLSGNSASSILLGSHKLTITEPSVVPKVFAGSITDAGGGSVTYSGAIGSSLTLSGTNAFSGGLTVTSGSLVLSGTDNFGAGLTNVTGGSLAVTGGTLTGNVQISSGTFAINGGGNVIGNLAVQGGSATVGASGALIGNATITGGTLAIIGAGTISGNVTVNTPGIFDISGATPSPTTVPIGNLAGSGTVTLGANTLNVVETSSTTFSGAINGTGSLEKSGTGTLALTGATSNYSGGTILNGGTLQIASNASLGALTGGINVISATTLQAIGPTISSSRTITLNAPLTIDTNSEGTVTWNGLITGPSSLTKTGPDTLILTAANNYSGGTTVSQGNLQGNTTSLQGNILDNATVTFDQPTNGTFSGTISGPGIINKINTGTLTFNTNQSGFSGNTNINAGTLDLENVLGGNVNVNNGGTLIGTGTIGNNLNVFSGGTVSPGNTSIGTLHVGGSYFQQLGGTYIWQGISTGQTDVINVAGRASLAGNLQIMFTGDCQVNTHYEILHAAGGVSGTFTNVFNLPMSTHPFINTAIFYTPNDVYLACQTIFENFANTPNEEAVAEQFDSIVNPNADQLEVINALLGLTPDQLRAALNEMAGEQYTFLIQLARYSNERFNQGIYNNIRGALIPCWCPDPCENIQTWGQAEAGQSYAGRDRNSAGVNVNNWNLSIGAHKVVRPGLIMGVAANYERDYANFRQGGHSTRQTGQGAIYAVARGDVFYVFADGIFGMTSGNFKRPIIFSTINRTATSKPQTTQGLLYGEFGLNYCVDTGCGCDLLIQPFLGVEYGHYFQKRIKECNAGSIDLTIHNINYNTFDTYLGMHFFGTIACVNFSADVAWQHRFDYKLVKINNHFEDFGSDFPIIGTDLGHEAIRGNVQASVQITDNINIYADIFGEGWKNWSAHGADMGIGIWW